MSEIETTTKKLNILAKHGINTNEDLLNLFPRSYKDFSKTYTEVFVELSGKTGCFIGEPYKLQKKFSNGRSIITFKILSQNNCHINCCIIGQNFMYNILDKMMEQEKIAVFGELRYEEPFGFSIMSPEHVCYIGSHREYLKIEPVYKKFDGISAEHLLELINIALGKFVDSSADSILLKKCGFDDMPSLKESYTNIHHPKSLELKPYFDRIKFEKLKDFAISLKQMESKESKGTTVILNRLDVVKSIISNLPYKLTCDQKDIVNEIILSIKEGKRVSALVQGDVGCGKTMIAILLLFAIAENDSQAVLMAPTAILATQHYEEIKKYGEMFGINVAYLDGSVKQSEKKKILAGLSTGEIKIVVGTHSLASDTINYKKLGLAIIDEEHRFGVEQRNKLLRYAEEGCNTVLMSATPIPRTIASSLHGSGTKIFEVRSMPAERKPIQTAICQKDETVINFIEKEVALGRQAYVVCPLIESDDEDKLQLRSLTDTVALYKEHFEPFYSVGCINGKMSASDMAKEIERFKKGETQILVATTVIEVGVSNPNATVIAITNAERFGLSTLHQLRGRVGRGSLQSYCILQSPDKDNKRLQTMCSCSDGFAIAEQDLLLRGAGDLTGNKQSGFTEIMNLIIEDQEFYEKVKLYADSLFEREFLIV